MLLRRTLLPLTAVVCLALTACSDDSEPTATAPTSDPTVSTSTATSEPTEEPTEEPTDEPTEASGTPSLDATAEAFLERLENGIGTRGTAHMVMRMTGPAASSSSGDLAYGPDGTRLRMSSTLPGAQGRMRMVVLPDVAFIGFPGLTPEGKFVRIGKDDPLYQQFAGAGANMGPAQSAEAFRAGLVSVEEVGEEQVQGVSTTRYTVVADAARALEAQGADVVPGMPETITYGVWLDEQDRMRRMNLTIQGTKLTVELSKWGEPVSIEAPAKSDLVERPGG